MLGIMKESIETRRAFVQAGAAAAVMATGADALAMDGGQKAVRVPAERVAEVTRWPRFNEEEKRAVVELLDNNVFQPHFLKN